MLRYWELNVFIGFFSSSFLPRIEGQNLHKPGPSPTVLSLCYISAPTRLLNLNRNLNFEKMLSSSERHFKKRWPAFVESSGSPVGERQLYPLPHGLSPLRFPSSPQRCVGISGKTLTDASNLEWDQSGQWRRETNLPAKVLVGVGGGGSSGKGWESTVLVVWEAGRGGR